MVGLRRITADYTSAITRWKSDKSDALDYLFRKEYDALSDSRSKLLLSALVIFASSQNQGVLQSILNCSHDQIQDAISEVREMFLRVEADENTGSTTYSLRSATRAFLSAASIDQDRFEEIKARVENFNRQALKTPPAILTLLNRARRNRQDGDAGIAWRLLTNSGFPKAATEHASFKAELGMTAAALTPPKLTEARSNFEDALLFGHRHYEMYLAWLDMEKAADSGTTKGIEVCLKVLGKFDFDFRTQATFRRKLAYLQAMKSRRLEMSSPEESSELRRASIINNLIAYRDATNCGVPNINGFRAQAADSLNKLHQGCGKWFHHNEFGKVVEEISADGVPLAPLSSEITSSFRQLLKSSSDTERRATVKIIRRISGKIAGKKIG